MKKNLTELVFILDKSGSMSGLEHDTIGGFNGMLKKQKEIDGECFITTVLFDHQYELLHDHMDIRAVRPITEKEYCIGGSTALLDAIGLTIHKIGMIQKNTSDDYRAEKVMFVIITDGEENASHHYSIEMVRNQINQQKEKYGWEFIFLGANIDAIKTAKQFGIDQHHAADYLADRKGTALNFSVMSEAIVHLRQKGVMPLEKLNDIREDVKKRKHSN